MARNPRSDFAALSALLNKPPRFDHSRHSNEDLMWFGRVVLIASPYLQMGDRATIGAHLQLRHTWHVSNAGETIKMLLYRALAQAEELCGGGTLSVGAAVQAGDLFQAFVEMTAVVKTATRELRIMDQWMDETILAECVLAANEDVSTFLLTSGQGARTQLLESGIDKWRQQFTNKRAIELRVARADQLHDREMFVDDVAVWVSTQAFKDFATTKPATFLPIDTTLMPAKRASFDSIWKTATVRRQM